MLSVTPVPDSGDAVVLVDDTARSFPSGNTDAISTIAPPELSMHCLDAAPIEIGNDALLVYGGVAGLVRLQLFNYGT
jgi:hypothetical protein